MQLYVRARRGLGESGYRRGAPIVMLFIEFICCAHVLEIRNEALERFIGILA